MAFNYILSLLLSHNLLLICASSAVHMHNTDSLERDVDGSYRSRDNDHYSEGGGHNFEFDHEAILGSVKEAEEFDKLSPEESKRRLEVLLHKMDLNGDQQIDRLELKKWILNSFVKLSKEDAAERMTDADDNKDGIVTWREYLQDAFGVDDERDVDADEGDSGLLLKDEKEMWAAADKNGDGKLDEEEFGVFSNPEEHPEMHGHIVQQTLREKDRNKDGKVDFKEFIGDRGLTMEKGWLIAEKEKFDRELDLNEDGVLDQDEIYAWVIPNNEEIATEEVDHLFASADDDHSDQLSFREVLDHHALFVGSHDLDLGDPMGSHFDDEL